MAAPVTEPLSQMEEVMIDHQILIDALGSTDWSTVDPLKDSSIKCVAHIMLSVLKEIPEGVRVGDLIDELKEIQHQL
jgi:hypothetical protein